jgi:hypothetical protein
VADAGAQTAALAFGGETATSYTAVTEEYNGTTWTTSPGLFKYSKIRFRRLQAHKYQH